MFRDDLWVIQKAGASGLAKRFRAVADNLANINTPGYSRKEVFFEDRLREAMDGKTSLSPARVSATEKRHIDPDHKPDLEGIVLETRAENESCRIDGNSVDPEIEMAKLARTRMAYNSVMKLMAKRAEMIKTSMGGR
ncbi:MAG TPA: flagellar basal body rod protein FlgB [Synergistales bacterium]|jgi:flagellar basal-body rod protein FlgB|nr:flagellar basal body rod protein FlgB [Synergistales bacterium]HRV71098.1 flagellar basal body rod protein FlgB [Thermovirgaceae bacterium]